MSGYKGQVTRDQGRATKEGPEPLAEILSRLFAARGWGRKQERLRIDQAWAEAAGKEFASSSRVLGIKRGVLEVEVASGVVMQEMAHFHKRRILADLRKRLKGMTIGDVKFRLGNFGK